MLFEGSNLEKNWAVAVPLLSGKSFASGIKHRNNIRLSRTVIPTPDTVTSSTLLGREIILGSYNHEIDLGNDEMYIVLI